MTEKLKPCPFCGGKAELEKGIGKFEHSVVCQDCRCKTKIHAFEEDAIKKWNTRKPMDRIVEQLEYALNNCIPVVNGKKCNMREKTVYEMALEYAIEIVKEGGKDELDTM